MFKSLKRKIFIIGEDERGFLIQEGRFIKILNPGRYYEKKSEILITKATGTVDTMGIPVEILLQDANFASSVTSFSMSSKQMGLLYIDDKLKTILSGGRKLYFWNIFETVTVDLFEPIGEVNLEKIPLDTILKNNSLKNNMKMIDISQNERAIHYINNEIVDILPSGIKIYWNIYENHTFVKSSLLEKINSEKFPIDVLLRADKKTKDLFTSVDIADFEIAFHYENGRIKDVLEAGTHYYWNIKITHSFETYDISKPIVQVEITNNMFDFIPKKLYTKIEVGVGEIGVVFYDNQFKKSYEPGIYYFWNSRIKVTCENYDMKLKELNIDANNLITKDKITLQINFFCNYRIYKENALAESVTNYEVQVINYIKTVINKYVSEKALDEILDNREKLSKYVLDELRKKEKEFYLRFFSAGVKEFILSDHIQSVMSLVLIAEKQAEAEIIRREEEIKSTKLLLETAKLMESNPTLQRLKELEYVERIFDRVDSVSFETRKDIIEKISNAITSVDPKETPVLRDIKKTKEVNKF